MLQNILLSARFEMLYLTSANRKNSFFSPPAWLLRRELSRQWKPRNIVWNSGLRNFSIFKSAGPDLWHVLVEVLRKFFCRAGLWNTRFWDRFLSKFRNSAVLTKAPKLTAAKMRCCPSWNGSFWGFQTQYSGRTARISKARSFCLTLCLRLVTMKPIA